MKIRQSFNAWGGLIGFLIGFCGILILVGFFKMTWSFWSGLADAALPDDYQSVVGKMISKGNNS